MKIGASVDTGAQTHIKKRGARLGLDTSHFKGQGWCKGMKLLYSRKPIEYFLQKNRIVKSDYLRRRLIAEGIREAKCEDCGISEWHGKEAPLELDHVNSDREDNRAENLRILCANCHAVKTRKL